MSERERERNVYASVLTPSIIVQYAHLAVCAFFLSLSHTQWLSLLSVQCRLGRDFCSFSRARYTIHCAGVMYL